MKNKIFISVAGLMVFYVLCFITARMCVRDNFFELAKKRQSIRAFSRKEVPQDKLNKILQCAIEAPSSCNRQAWRFLIVKDENAKEFMSKWRGLDRIRESSAIICVFVDSSFYRKQGEDKTQYMDGSAALMNIIYAAQSLGLSSCWVNCPHSEEKRKELLDFFKLSEDLRPISLVTLGYRKGGIKKPARKPLKYYILPYSD
ncbi:MAG: nitroreductase family protein [Candidatus Omnitrophica bacterium]|nr:nitroreductase family protein [Candidatus Omnitrophota bacterium]